jgi:hypothetical protein
VLLNWHRDVNVAPVSQKRTRIQDVLDGLRRKFDPKRRKFDPKRAKVAE